MLGENFKSTTLFFPSGGGGFWQIDGKFHFFTIFVRTLPFFLRILKEKTKLCVNIPFHSTQNCNNCLYSVQHCNNMLYFVKPSHNLFYSVSHINLYYMQYENAPLYCVQYGENPVWFAVQVKCMSYPWVFQ
jgi:hypothetical protein